MTKAIFFILIISSFQVFSEETPILTAPPTVQIKKLKISPVSINVVGEAEIKFVASGGTPPYKFSASSGNLFRKKNTAVLSTPEAEATIYVYVKDSNGVKAQSEVIVSPPHKKEE